MLLVVICLSFPAVSVLGLGTVGSEGKIVMLLVILFVTALITDTAGKVSLALFSRNFSA